MGISESQYRKLLDVVEHFSGGIDSFDIRQKAGIALLDLLQADYFASYVWSRDERKFCDKVFVNMDPDNLERYDRYYQYHDPITGKLQRFRRPVSVNEVISQEELVASEFFNDFLSRDGLYYGVNLYVYDGDENIGDIRIWRNRHRQNFDRGDLEILELIKPHFRNAMKNIRLLARQGQGAVSAKLETDGPSEYSIIDSARAAGLTRREIQIALEICHGKTDTEIADSLCIGLSTIRTHTRHIYRKLGVHNRTALSHRLLRPKG